MTVWTRRNRIPARRQQRPVRLGVELLEARELLDAASTLLGDVAQLRHDTTASSIALVNAVQSSSTNTPTPISFQSQWNKAWNVLATDWNRTWQAFVQVEYAALGAIRQEFNTLLHDLGIQPLGQTSAPSPPAPSSTDARTIGAAPPPNAAPLIPNTVPPITSGPVGSDTNSNDPSQTYTTPGTYILIASLTGTLTVQCWGAGGGGIEGLSGGAGGGGGGGGYAVGNVNVVAGQTYTIVVGAGGHGGLVYPDRATAGGSSYFSNTTTIDGGGGGPGAWNPYGNGGIPGQGSGGSTRYAGGAGGKGYITNQNDYGGGGGGGGAGSTAAGSAGSASANGTSGGAGGAGGSPDGGAGGNGGNNGANGSAGSTLGGGGGGGGQNGYGGNGANGEVKISWTGSNSPLLSPVMSFCNCGCPNEPGSTLQVNPSSTGPAFPPVSPDPVRYADGVATIAATDLHSSGFGFDWGQTRTWSNGAGYATGSVNGSGWVDTYIPHLIQSDGSTNNTIIFIANGDTASYYNLVNGVYQPLLDDGSKLTYNSTSDTFTLTDTQGDKIVLNGFGTTRPAAQRGEFASYTDPYGTQMAVTSYTSSGTIGEMQRSATVNSNTTTESWLYSYLPTGNANAGLMSNVTLRTKVNSGAWSTMRQVAYSYYDGTQQYGGNLGDLMTATVEDGSSNVLSTSYYRYFKSGDPNGYTHGLKYVFNPDSYERLTAALGTNLASLTDAQVSPYADNAFQYNSAQQVSQETVQGAGDSQTGGGLGTYTYSYTNSSNPQGTNSWFTKTVVTNPDSSTDTIYTNAFAEVMLDDHYDPSSGLHTDHYYEYNNQGQLILEAAPSAITGYSDASANLSPSLNNTSGLITDYAYYSTTTATATAAGGVANYLEDVQIQQGQTGTLIPQETWQYYAQSYNGQTIAPVATDSVYGSTGSGDPRTTSYSYTWFSGTAQIQSETDTAPVIAAGQNGPAAADVTTTYFDTYGNAQWIKDPDGYIQYNAYDPVTGALLTNIADVQTTDTGEFTNLPSGWSTPSGGGLNLITTDVVDALGRTTKETSPNGNVTYYVYLDPQHEERIYRGWNSSTNLPTGSTEVIRDDATDGYTETFTMTATPHLTNNAPDGTEAISGLQTLTRDYTNAAGQVTAEYAYFNLGSLTYSTGTMGTVNVNYYQTNYGYDNWGRLVRTQTPNGTIYRTVYNSLNEKVSDWVGTNDTPTSGEWSPTNNTGSANMVEVRSYQYDNGGVGDGNLTQETDYSGLGAANRVTDFWYDWRDRLVAQKSGVQASENDGTNRPIIVYTYDNLNEVTETQQYLGDGVTPIISNGVLSPLAANSLRAQEIVSYDDQGRVYQTQVYDVNPTNGAVSSTALTTNDYYDHRGDLIAESAPGGLWTKSQYDGAGRDVMDYTTDGAGGTTWAEAGSLTGDTVLEQNQTLYDSDGNVIETIDSQRFHNATGHGVLLPQTGGISARVYYAANYYDNADRLTASVDVGTNGGTAWTRPSTPPSPSATVLVQTYAYNSMGLVQDVTDPQGIDTRTLYDNLGRVTKTIEDYTGGTPGNENDVATEYGYDGNNNVTYVQADQPGGSYQQTKYVYAVTTAAGDGLNSNDILSAVQHPDPTSGNPSSSQQDSYLVNALGDVVQSTDRNGNVHQFSYDVLDRETADAVTTLGSGVDGSVRRIQYAYDSQGNAYLTTTYNAASGGSIVNQVQDVFNGLDQLTGEYQSHSGAVVQGTTPEVQYAYTEMSGSQNNSRLTSMTYPKGYVLNYNYNTGLDSNISRLSSISDASNTLESYKYLGLDTVVERDHPQNNVNLTYISQNGQTGDAGDPYVGLDRFARVVDQNWYNTTTQTSTDDFQYGYSQDSDALYRQNVVDSVMSELYQYDNLHQVTNFQRGTLNSTHNGIVGSPSASQSWSPDALGNFSSVTTNGTQQTRTHNQQNEITGISGAGTVTYDANGNLTADGTGNTFVYDAWNQLVTVKNNGTTIAAYGYDGLGHRITQMESGTTTDLYYSSADQVLEEDVGGVIQARNVWSPVYVNALMLRDQSSQHNGTLDQRLYVQQDANWNVTALVDTSGNVLERFDYLPYGAVTGLSASWGTYTGTNYNVPYGFQGMRADLTVGLNFADNRVYSPTLMRWLQTDPIGLNAGNNDYAMEGNKPTEAVDPLGLFEPVTTTAAGLALGPFALGAGAAFLGYWTGQGINRLTGFDDAVADWLYPPPPPLAPNRMPPRVVPIENGRGKRKPGPDKVEKDCDKEAKPDKAACSKAIKLLEQYKRLLEDQGKKWNDKVLQRLNELRDSGRITSNDLPGSLQTEFPKQFKGMTLDEIRKKCGKSKKR